MKIKIKSREEIEKTLDQEGYHIDKCGAYFNSNMYQYSSKELEVVSEFESYYFGYKVRACYEASQELAYNWHPDWYEVLEPDFTEEDLMDIELMNEMLAYFIESK